MFATLLTGLSKTQLEELRALSFKGSSHSAIVESLNKTNGTLKCISDEHAQITFHSDSKPKRIMATFEIKKNSLSQQSIRLGTIQTEDSEKLRNVLLYPLYDNTYIVDNFLEFKKIIHQIHNKKAVENSFIFFNKIYKKDFKYFKS